MTSIRELHKRNLIKGEIDNNKRVIEYMDQGLNYDELKNYIEFKINMLELEDGELTHYPFGFR